MKGLFAAVSAGVLLMSASAWAQGAASQQSLSNQDREFIQHAGAGNLAEVELGKLAQKKAEAPTVKMFGRWMATDHEFANKRLLAIMQELNHVQQPTLTQKDKELAQKLEGMSGEQFDQHYIQAMVEDHQKDIKLFEKQAQQGQAQPLKTYAQNFVPVLQEHLAQAEELQSHMGVASGAQPSGSSMSGSSVPPKATTRQLNQHELNQMQK